MEILSAKQIKAADEYTIANEPVKSIDLMERAALACVRRLVKLIDSDRKLVVACGKGNNGGDGLAITRLLHERGFDVKVLLLQHKKDFSPDALANYELFKNRFPEKIYEACNLEELKEKTQPEGAMLIDALLGSGINGPVEGFLGEAIQYFNKSFEQIISIDVPSGLAIDETSIDFKNIIRSTLTLSLQLPKLAFLMAENKNYVPHFETVDIGLNEQSITGAGSKYHYLTKEMIAPLFKKRNKFDHKGTFGHALLLAGSKGKPGAAIISAKACLRSGAGLLTVHSCKNVLSALPIAIPEAMSSEDENEEYISSVIKPENYDAIGFGPGVGLHEETQQALKKLLNYYKGNLVIDADGLNILSENKTWLSFLPPDTILTPHPKEFERLAGKSENDFERLTALKQFALKYNCVTVLKGAHSAIAMPDGHVYFNSSGNAGLAKAGTGDGLTGIILGLLARGYNPPQAAMIGVYIHGYAADLCAKKMSLESILISDVIEALPKAFRKTAG